MFLPMHDSPVGRRVAITPGKTYEYLAAGRPILAAVPDGDARDLLEQAGNAILCRPADVDGLAAAILAEWDRKAANSAPPVADDRVLAPFERRALTKKLAAVFDRTLATAALQHGS
jgi:glycosyltransferase involved in cell wall biosynthesis